MQECEERLRKYGIQASLSLSFRVTVVMVAGDTAITPITAALIFVSRTYKSYPTAS